MCKVIDRITTQTALPLKSLGHPVIKNLIYQNGWRFEYILQWVIQISRQWDSIQLVQEAYFVVNLVANARDCKFRDGHRRPMRCSNRIDRGPESSGALLQRHCIEEFGSRNDRADQIVVQVIQHRRNRKRIEKYTFKIRNHWRRLQWLLHTLNDNQ